MWFLHLIHRTRSPSPQRRRRKKLHSAHELDQLFVGEIGFQRREFLHDLKWWEVKSIIRGYRRRERTSCIMSRRMTFWQVKTSMADTKKISTPSDLWPLPWDKEEKDTAPQITEEEQQEMQDLIKAENARRAALRESSEE